MNKFAKSILVLGFAFVLAGCASTEPENTSSRPWNSPQGWEGGFPASINEGR